jgi:hypothetical protein
MQRRIGLSRRRWVLPSAVVLGVSLGIVILAGCGDDDSAATSPDAGGGTDSNPGVDTGPGADGSVPPDPGNIMQVSVAGNSADVTSPFDSTPDPTGTSIFFTGIATADGTSGIFKVAAAGGAVTKLFSGTPLVHALGITITTDGAQLFIADPAADTASDSGQIYSLPAAGGTPTAVAGTDGYQPKAVAVVGQTLYFTGTDKTSGLPGVFKLPVGGGAIQVVTSGPPLQDPTGVVANAAGDVFVVDSSSSNGLGVVYKVAAGQTAAVVVSGSIGVGYPAGVALSGDGTALLASSINQTTYKDEVRRIDLATGQFTVNAAGPIANNIEAAGLHRAHNANVYSWADSLAGGGTVYLLK